MSKEGYEANHPFSRTFRAATITTRGFRFRDLKSSTNREIAARQKRIYLKTEAMMMLARGEKLNDIQRAWLDEEI